MSSNLQDLALRALTADDFELLAEWINAPHVAKFWDGKTDVQAVREKYSDRLTEQSSTRVFIATLNGQPVGMIQCYRHADYPDWDAAVKIKHAAGIDYLIGAVEYTGKGFGPAMIHLIAKYIFEKYDDIDCIVSAPQQNNYASCRALEKAGFHLKETRKLDSNCVSDSDVSSIYLLQR